MAFQYYNWEEVHINWEALDMNWEMVGILISDVLPNVSVPLSGKPRKIDLKKINELPEDKKRIIIKVACQIEEHEYIEYKYKNQGEIQVTTEHIDIIVDKIINNIKVNVQNIS